MSSMTRFPRLMVVVSVVALGGLVGSEEDWGVREVCREVVGRMKRMWEIEAE